MEPDEGSPRGLSLATTLLMGTAVGFGVRQKAPALSCLFFSSKKSQKAQRGGSLDSCPGSGSDCSMPEALTDRFPNSSASRKKTM